MRITLGFFPHSASGNGIWALGSGISKKKWAGNGTGTPPPPSPHPLQDRQETILSRNYHKKYYSDKTTDPQIYAAPQLPLQCAKTIFHRLSVVHGIYSGPVWESLADLSFGGLDRCSPILPWRSPLSNWAGSLHRFRHPSLQQRVPSTHNLSSRQVFLNPTGQTKFSGGLGQVP